MTDSQGTDATVPDSRDLRAAADAVLAVLAQVPDDGWERPAHRLDWDCRDTVAHLCDDFGFYAMNLAGTAPPQTTYVRSLEPPPWREGSPPMVFWPDPEGGTSAVLEVVDATAGLLVAVTATAPAGKIGFHPAGNADASGFAAMGIVEGACHAWDVATAHGLDFRLDDGVARRTLTRIFPDADHGADDAWAEFLRATGRAEETHDQHWRWYSDVRPSYP